MHVGSIFSNKSASLNQYPPSSSNTNINSLSKDYRKGVLLRRSLAQTPPIFKKDKVTHDSTVVLDVDSSVNRRMVLYIKENEGADKTEKKPKSKIFKITPKHLPKKFTETVKENSPSLAVKKPNGKLPLNNYPTENFLVTSRDRNLHHDIIRKKIFKRTEKELARITPQKVMAIEDSAEFKNNPRYCFLENSISEIPMSYRITKTDSSLTPYAHSQLKSSTKAPMRDSLRKRV